MSRKDPWPMPEVHEHDGAAPFRWRRNVNEVSTALSTAPGTVTYRHGQHVEVLGAEVVTVTIGWDAGRGRPAVVGLAAEGIAAGSTFARWTRDLPAAALEWDAIGWLTTALVMDATTSVQLGPDGPAMRQSFLSLGPGAVQLMPGYVESLQRGSSAARPKHGAPSPERVALDYLVAARDAGNERAIYDNLLKLWSGTELECERGTARKRVHRAAALGFLTRAEGNRRAVREAGPELPPGSFSKRARKGRRG